MLLQGGRMFSSSLSSPELSRGNTLSSLHSRKMQKQDGQGVSFSPQSVVQSAIDDAIANVKLSNIPKLADKAVKGTGIMADIKNFMQTSIQDAKKFFSNAFKDFGKGTENIPGLNGDFSSIKGDYHALFQQAEKATFEAKGSVTTADGKEVSFSLAIEVKAVYKKEVSVRHIPSGGGFPSSPATEGSGSDFANSLLPPLDFGGKASDLFNKLFLFDLYGKGKEGKENLHVGKGLLQFSDAVQKEGNQKNRVQSVKGNPLANSVKI